MRLASVALAVAAVAALSLLAPAGAAASLPGGNGRIAFAKPGRGIWDVNADGSGQRRLSPSNDPTFNCDAAPAYSPTGLELAFEGCDPERHATVLETMTSLGVTRNSLFAGSSRAPSPQSPAFSPKGDQVVFSAGLDATRLFVIRTDGTGLRRLPGTGYEPSWSSRGQIAYAVPQNQRRFCNSTELDDVYVMRSDRKHVKRITRNYGSYDPDWSPDGKRLAYARDYTVSSKDAKNARGTMDCKPVLRRASRYGPEIVVSDANGKHARRLTRSGGSNPAWSPNGKLIAFERGGWIWTMNADGSKARRLVPGADPSWQPLPSPLPRRERARSSRR